MSFIAVGVLIFLVLGLVLGFIIIQSAFSHRHWRRVIAQGDQPTLLAAVEEALETFRGMRAPRGTPPADWRGLQSAALVAADRDRARVSLIVEPDVRVIGTERREVGPAENVARRVAVRMVERLLYEIPLARFQAVQVDVYTEYRSPQGQIATECLLTTQVSRLMASESDWDELEAAAILADWRTREREPGQRLDPEEGALIAPMPSTNGQGGLPPEDAGL
ncbi:MAG: hypothetical protein AB7I38_08180 [Dehalococcoidia bacterium]